VTRHGGGKDVFLHATAMPPGAFEKLTVGTVLTYRVRETDRGPQATDAEFVSVTDD
jgi:cold shock CspA family protein